MSRVAAAVVKRGDTVEPEMELVYRFANAAVQRADGLRWDLDGILRGLAHGVALCSKASGSAGVRAIAVDGWAVDYVRLGANGHPVASPFCYRDDRTAEGEREMHARISAERMREITGIQLLPLNTVYQMAADSAALRAMPWLNLPEYILHRLGGRLVAERSNASHTQMLTVDGAWSAEIVGALEQEMSLMPEVVAPGTDLGVLTGPLADLKAYQGTRLIAPCCHDTASAIAAVPDAGDDWAYISSGTWSLVGTVLRAADDSAESRSENFTNLAGADGAVCFHKNVNGMWLLRQCIESWNAEAYAPLEIVALVKEAEAVAAPKFFLEVDDPDLLHSGRMVQRINAQLRRRHLPEFEEGPTAAAVVASFIFYSLAARYAEVLRKVTAITGKKLARVYIFGGGSQNEFLNRLTAEATGMPVVRVGAECSTVGNFAVQMAALEGGLASEWAGVLAGVHQGGE